MTGEVQKAKYVYYRCTGHRGKCGLPRFREEDIANRQGEPLRGLQVPPEVVSQIVSTVQAATLPFVYSSSNETLATVSATGLINRLIC